MHFKKNKNLIKKVIGNNKINPKQSVINPGIIKSTAAMAIEMGTFSPHTLVDVSQPVKIGNTNPIKDKNWIGDKISLKEKQKILSCVFFFSK